MVMPRVKVVKEKDEEEEMMIKNEPVSPTGQYFNSSSLSVVVLAVFESVVLIDDSPTISTLQNLLLPVNPRFSSVMVRDDKGTKQWKRVSVKLEDHVYVPVFPSGEEYYDEYVSDYLSKIAMEPFPQNMPLWSIHIVKYPTRSSAGTIVFKLHHALGDGFSLMAALFSCLQRADNPSLPLTFPSSNSKQKPANNGLMGIVGEVPRGLSVCLNTVKDFGWSLLKSNFLEDDKCPVRSGDAGVEFKPVTITTVEFSLDDIHKIKIKIGGTINDVISGIVFFGTQLYLQDSGRSQGNSPKVTALVLLNTRIIGSYEPLSEMTKPDAKSAWGNQFGFLHVAIPSCEDVGRVDPLQFVRQAKRIIQQKRSSLAVYLTGRLLETLRRVIGSDGTAKYIHSTLKNTSMTVSNLTGPMEQIQIAGHPIKSFHFMVVGVPQSLTVTVVSYMGKLTMAMGVEKGFIDPKLLVSCMEQSFERIFEAAVGMKPGQR